MKAINIGTQFFEIIKQLSLIEFSSIQITIQYFLFEHIKYITEMSILCQISLIVLLLHC